MSHFSVIIPLYNKAPFVRKAMESVVGQSYTDWELIVVDNGSTDGSGTIAAQCSDSRIKVLRLETNIGPGGARNIGVAKSSAPWICFLDADDWWEPTFLEEMAGLTERHPKAGIYGTGYFIVKNGRKKQAPIGVDKDFGEGEIDYCQVYSRTLCMPLTGISVCMPRTVFEDNGGFPQDIRLGEDFLLWIHVALKHPVILLNKPLSNYNQDADPTHRATQHLVSPERHMLWNLGDLEELEATDHNYKQLIDKVRTYSLMPYLLDRRHRADAQRELAKVNWSHQPASIRRLYKKPIAVLLMQFRLRKLLSNAKQMTIKIVHPQ